MKDKVKLQARRDLKKEAIITKCCTAFVKRGLEHTTIIDLCEAAQINPKIMYDHFETKEAIVVVCAKRCIENIIKNVEKHAKNITNLFEDINAMIDDCYANRGQIKFFFQVLISPNYKEDIKEYLDKLYEMYAECKQAIHERLNIPYNYVDAIFNLMIGVIDYYCLTEDEHYLEVSKDIVFKLVKNLMNDEPIVIE